MRRALILAALCSLGLTAVAHAGKIPIDQLKFPIPRDHKVRVDFPVGEFRIESTTGNSIEFELSAKCKGSEWHCEDRADDIRVESDDTGGELRLEVKGYHGTNPGFELIGVLRVPRDHSLEVQMGVGELAIEGVEGDMDVNLGVGEAHIRASQRTFRSVDVASGIGDADVYSRGGRVHHRGFISSTASWDDGPGRSTVTLHVGVGEARVSLD
jgi:hypothetical protein